MSVLATMVRHAPEIRTNDTEFIQWVILSSVLSMLPLHATLAKVGINTFPLMRPQCSRFKPWPSPMYLRLCLERSYWSSSFFGRSVWLDIYVWVLAGFIDNLVILASAILRYSYNNRQYPSCMILEDRWDTTSNWSRSECSIWNATGTVPIREWWSLHASACYGWVYIQCACFQAWLFPGCDVFSTIFAIVQHQKVTPAYPRMWRLLVSPSSQSLSLRPICFSRFNIARGEAPHAR